MIGEKSLAERPLIPFIMSTVLIICELLIFQLDQENRTHHVSIILKISFIFIYKVYKHVAYQLRYEPKLILISYLLKLI